MNFGILVIESAQVASYSKAVITSANLADTGFEAILSSPYLAGVFSGTKPGGHSLILNDSRSSSCLTFHTHGSLLELGIYSRTQMITSLESRSLEKTTRI